MSDGQVQSLGDGRVGVSGKLTFETVTDVLRQSTSVFSAATGAVQVDLSAVTRADSAGLALLIQWLRTAREQNKSIVFHHIPEQMLAIARISDLEDILPLGEL